MTGRAAASRPLPPTGGGVGGRRGPVVRLWMTYSFGALGGRSHLLRYQLVTKVCQTIRCISNPKVPFKRCAMTSPTEAPPHLRTDRGCRPKHPTDVRRSSDVESTGPVPASDRRAPSVGTFKKPMPPVAGTTWREARRQQTPHHDVAGHIDAIVPEQYRSLAQSRMAPAS